MVTVPRLIGLASAALLTGAALSSISAVHAQVPARPAPPTFSKDVLPILQRSCQACHRPDTMAPMSLLTYAEARPWAKSIKTRVTTREMLPWHIDRSIGEYSNDPSLSDKEIATIAAW